MKKKMSCIANEELAVVILAGGASKRMGSNKLKLPIGKTNLLNHTIEIFENAHCKNIFLSGNLPYKNSIPDKTSGLGPMEGIRTSLNYLNKMNFKHILFTAADLPLIHTNFILSFISSYYNKNINYYKGYPLPFIVSFQGALKGFDFNNKNNSVYNFLENIEAKFLIPNETEKNILNGVNTPEEWENIKHYL